MDRRERQARYIRFFWPLALTGSIALTAPLLKNYFLLEFPDGIRELAVFALAWSIFMPLQSAMWMVPQAVNALVVDRGSLLQSARFFAGLATLMTACLLLLGFTDMGLWLLHQVYDIDPVGLQNVQDYLKWFAPLPALMTAGQFLQGMMIRAEATGRTTLVEVLRIASMAAVFLLCKNLGWSAMKALVAAQLTADVLAISLRLLFLWPLRKRWAESKSKAPTYREIGEFFAPIAFTTLMFSLSRPIVFGFATNVDPSTLGEGVTLEMMIAGLNLAWSLAPLFVNPLNQFRSVFVNYAREDLEGVVRLLRQVVAITVGLWIVTAWSGLAAFFFQTLQGADQELSRIGEDAFRALVILPLFMGWRNYYHGLSLAYRRTRSMGVAAIIRVGMIFLMCWTTFELGLFNAVGAAICFGSGFIVETFASLWGTRDLRKEIQSAHVAPPL